MKKIPCIDCGKPCLGKGGGRCHKCGGIAMWKRRHIEAKQFERIAPKYCVDCGKQIKYTNTRCQYCSRVHNCTLRVGPENPGWKGGRFKTSGPHGGYIRVKSPNHPRANKQGYMLEHILIWEKTHNKTLPEGWIIHHLNGIKDDNHPRNLIAFPNKKHYLVLHAKAKRIQELEAILNGQRQLL